MESRNKTTKSHYQVGAGCSAAEEQGEGEGDVEEEAASPISNLADESTLGDHAPPTTATASTTCNDGERGKMDGGGVKIPPAGGGSDYYDGDEEGKRRRWKQENADVDADGDEKRNVHSTTVVLHNAAAQEDMQMAQPLTTTLSVCYACHDGIFDRFIMRLFPNMEFHADCLRCCECGHQLGDEPTAFFRNDKVYCRDDYSRLYARRCGRCHQALQHTDMVMRAGDPAAASAGAAAAAAIYYHLDCFQCSTCRRVLSPGEQYVLHGHELFCRPDCFQLALGRLQLQMSAACSQHPPPTGTAPLSGGTGWPPLNLPTALQPKPNVIIHSHPQLPPLPPPLGSFEAGNGSSGVVEQPQLQLIGDQPLQGCIQHSSSQQPADQNQPPLSASGGSAIQRSSLSSSTGSPSASYSNTDSDIPPASNSTTTASSSMVGGLGSGRMGSSTSVISCVTGGGGGRVGKKGRSDKPTQRIRTVLNEAQLKILKHMYNQNQRPDTVTKEHLVEMTGLSARVIRVWFQNKRCKDKKRQIAIKELHEQHEKEQTLHGVRLNGVGPLVADSPTMMHLGGGGGGEEMPPTPMDSNNNNPSAPSAGGATPTGQMPLLGACQVPLFPTAAMALNPIDIHQFPQNAGLWGFPAELHQHASMLPPAQQSPSQIMMQAMFGAVDVTHQSPSGGHQLYAVPNGGGMPLVSASSLSAVAATAAAAATVIPLPATIPQPPSSTPDN